MTIVFPGALLRPRSINPGLMGQSADGGPSLVGPSQSAELAGGGWWTMDYDLGDRPGANRLKLIRALLMRMQNGAADIIMPFCDEPQAPWPGAERGPALTGYSDGSVFSDRSRFSQGRIDFRLNADLEENATSASITRVSGADLTGGELMTLVHSEVGIGATFAAEDRVYCLDSVEQTGADTFDIHWGPPTRGPSRAGDLADFERPRCVMKQISAGPSWPTVTAGWKAASALRFVESFDYLREE